MNDGLEVIERTFSYKMRVWDLWVGDEHIGVVGYNKESENIHYKVTHDIDHEKCYVQSVLKAFHMVKSQLIEEVLLGDI